MFMDKYLLKNKKRRRASGTISIFIMLSALYYLISLFIGIPDPRNVDMAIYTNGLAAFIIGIVFLISSFHLTLSKSPEEIKTKQKRKERALFIALENIGSELEKKYKIDPFAEIANQLSYVCRMQVDNDLTGPRLKEILKALGNCLITVYSIIKTHKKSLEKVIEAKDLDWEEKSNEIIEKIAKYENSKTGLQTAFIMLEEFAKFYKIELIKSSKSELRFLTYADSNMLATQK